MPLSFKFLLDKLASYLQYIKNIKPINQLNSPIKLNQYANIIVKARSNKKMDGNAVLIPVTPAFFPFLITTGMKNIKTIVKIIYNPVNTIFRPP